VYYRPLIVGSIDMAGVIVRNRLAVIPIWKSLAGCQCLQPCCSVLVQQLRHKGNKRFVLPPTAKEKDKWISKMKKDVKVETVIPPKVLEKFMQRVPEDDVWIREHYPTPRYRLVDVLLMHRELASPEMTNNMEGLVMADFDLDMSTKKKTKFMGSISGTVLFPHIFDDGINNRVVAITKSPEQQEIATKMGATFVGGLDIIKLLERGEIRHDDYDHVVCDPDVLPEVALIKKHLKDHFPNRKKGNLGPDVGALVNLFVKGRTFESHKESEATAKMSQCFGKLNMPDEELSKNFQTLVDTVSALKAPSLGKLISKVVIRCPPSIESFTLRDSEVVPQVVASAARESVVEADDEPEQEEEKERGEA